MMLALTVKEVQSSGNILTFRLSETRQQTTSSREARRRKRKEGTWGHVSDCCYDVHERGRQWTTGRGSLKGMASVGWQDGQRERGKCATAERDKCGRTNQWWLTGSFIHYCDQIQQDSPPYGMAQLIHPITCIASRAREGEAMACVCAHRGGGFANATGTERVRRTRRLEGSN